MFRAKFVINGQRLPKTFFLLVYKAALNTHYVVIPSSLVFEISIDSFRDFSSWKEDISYFWRNSFSRIFSLNFNGLLANRKIKQFVWGPEILHRKCFVIISFLLSISHFRMLVTKQFRRVTSRRSRLISPELLSGTRPVSPLRVRHRDKEGTVAAREKWNYIWANVRTRQMRPQGRNAAVLSDGLWKW